MGGKRVWAPSVFGSDIYVNANLCFRCNHYKIVIFGKPKVFTDSLSALLGHVHARGVIIQFGLIAEEVAKVNPALVLPDKEGKPYTVRYDSVNAMLLNKFLKEHRTVQELKSIVAKQEAIATRQQKQIEALTAGLQKVRPTYWEIIADNLSTAGWSWGCVSALDSSGRISRHVYPHRVASFCFTS